MLEEAKLQNFLSVTLAYSNKGKTMNDMDLQPSQRKEVKRAVEPGSESVVSMEIMSDGRK